MNKKKQQLLKDGAAFLFFPSEEVVDVQYMIDLFLDEERLNSAIRMSYRGQPIHLSHIEKLRDEFEVCYDAGLISDVEMAYLNEKLDTLGRSRMTSRKILEAKLEVYKAKENYEACAGIMEVLKGMP